jgi:hypothetical protein
MTVFNTLIFKFTTQYQINRPRFNAEVLLSAILLVEKQGNDCTDIGHFKRPFFENIELLRREFTYLICNVNLHRAFGDISIRSNYSELRYMQQHVLII